MASAVVLTLSVHLKSTSDVIHAGRIFLTSIRYYKTFAFFVNNFFEFYQKYNLLSITEWTLSRTIQFSNNFYLLLKPLPVGIPRMAFAMICSVDFLIWRI